MYFRSLSNNLGRRRQRRPSREWKCKNKVFHRKECYRRRDGVADIWNSTEHRGNKNHDLLPWSRENIWLFNTSYSNRWSWFERLVWIDEYSLIYYNLNLSQINFVKDKLKLNKRYLSFNGSGLLGQHNTTK